MGLQLVGLNRCSSCSAEGVVWTCPVCDTSAKGEVSDDGGEVTNLGGLRCGGCGEDREVVTYVVPEALTDFWVHEVRSAERIGRVEFSATLGRPTAMHLRKILVQVEEMLFFVRVGDGPAAFGATPHGAYVLRTELGLCVVVSAPHELGEGEVSAGITDWFLVEADGGMREALRGRRGGGRARAEEGEQGLEDDGLLRNAYAYRIVYRAENALRTLVSQRLAAKVSGVRQWWKAAAPEGLRRRVEEVGLRRRASAWFELPDADPILLTTLGELRDLLEGDWGVLGSGLGPKEVVLGALRKLEFYRNELAHCRPLTLRMVNDLHNVERSLERIAKLAR